MSIIGNVFINRWPRCAGQPIRALDSDTPPASILGGHFWRHAVRRKRSHDWVMSSWSSREREGRLWLLEICSRNVHCFFPKTVTHTPPNFPGVAHYKIIRCGLTYCYGWAMNDRSELFGQIARWGSSFFSGLLKQPALIWKTVTSLYIFTVRKYCSRLYKSAICLCLKFSCHSKYVPEISSGRQDVLVFNFNRNARTSRWAEW